MKKQRLSNNVYTLGSDKPPEAENDENEVKEEKDKDEKVSDVLFHATSNISSRKEKYQIRVKIIEGRQLAGANVNPVCKITLRGVSKQTRAVKSSTNPWWDEIFFFHFEFTPPELYSEILEIRVNNARAFRSNTLIGYFKLDLGIIYERPQHVFINKWLLLGNPEDTVPRAMGYLKFSAAVLGPGDDCPNLSTPEHTEEEDVESNLLLSAGVQLKPASFIFDVHQAIDLPQMDSSVGESVKKMLYSERTKDLVDPYLLITFAGRKAQSAIIRGKDHPEWNERLFLDFQFPSMCEKIRLQLTDWDRLTEDDVIATYMMPIPHISAPGDYGYLPTFGPSWVNFYGSPREYRDLNNDCELLNKGRGEGCAYRGRALLSIKTNLGAFSEVKSMPIDKTELLQVMPYCRRRKYRLHAAFIDASMVSVIDTPVEFEVSIGCPLEGANYSFNSFSTWYPFSVQRLPGNFGNKFEDTLTPSPSSTQPTNAVFDGCNYYFLPWKEVKPCVIITSQWEDIAFRLETVNLLQGIIDNLQQHVKDVNKDIRMGKSTPELAVKFISMMDDLLKDLDFELPQPIPGQHIATDLDNQLRELRKSELKNLHKKATLLRESATDVEEALAEIETYIKVLQSLSIEPQNSIPDVVIWMLSGKERVAYCRIPPHQILFSPDTERCGKYCGKLQSVILKYPITAIDTTDDNKSKQSSNIWSSKHWKVPAVLRVKLWFGLEVYDVFWSTCQTDAEMSVFAETYENQVSVFGKWTTGGPTMTRPAWSDANGIISLPRENFVAPYGWRFESDWFVSPEPSMMYEEEAYSRTFMDEIYENESRMPGGQWSPAPIPWTDFSGESTLPKHEIKPPQGWIWETNWEVDLNRAVDEDGWEYTLGEAKDGYQPVEMTHHLCRRRRWVRQRICMLGVPELAYDKDEDDDTMSVISIRSFGSLEEGWEYAPLFNMKFHAKEKRMDLVRRRRWHRKLVAEDPSAPLVFNLAATPKKTSIVRKMMGTETSSETKTVEDAKLAMLSCPRLFLIFKNAHKFQLRAYLYQARDLIAGDRSGFSDPYVCISIMNQSKKTVVILQSLCPTWDQTLIFEDVVFYGDVETVKAEPPIIVIEVYDQDAYGDDEFLGRVRATPVVHLNPSKSEPPRLEWFELLREKKVAGELLASFELFLADVGDLPYLPPKRGDLFIVPTGIRPILQRTAVEILCWGVRNMKTFEFSHISRPSVEFECGGTVIESTFIKDAKTNPNFTDPVLFIEMLLPLEEIYMPPMHIKVRDHRQFGRKPIVGTHVIRSLHAFRCDPVFPTKETVTTKENVTKVESDTEKMGEKIKSQLEEIIVGVVAEHQEESKDQHDESEAVDWWAKYYSSLGDTRKAGTYLQKEYDTIEIYRKELEKQDVFQGFTDFLSTFPLKRGKTKDLEESDTVGEFKGSLRVYPLPPDPKAPQPMRIFQGLTQATVEEILIRVYIVKAIDLAPMDLNGLADPYVVLKLNKKKQDNKDHYKPNTINPTFGEMFELSGTLPIDKDLVISVWDYDLTSGDDLIGTTVIDLENRYVTKYRATCGLPKTYQISGPNKWRDSKTPKEILIDVCQLQNLSPPVFDNDKIYIGDIKYNIKDFEKSESKNTHLGPVDQRLALHILHEFSLVPEHVETRSLYNPTTPELEQGKLEMWVDIFPKSLGKPGSTVDITPRSATKYELRIVVWNTSDVLLTETNILGEQMSDIYVKGWISGMDDVQKTDVHYRSMDGEGNFNWRFVFPFEYLLTENNIVVKKKEHFWSLDVTEQHIPAKLILQIWDNDTFSSDDFIGSLEMDLTCMPQPAKFSSKCCLQQLGYERKKTALDKLILKSHKPEIEYINIFEKRRIYGYWPFVTENPDEGPILAGKIEMEMEIVSEEEIEKKPAGHGRDDPNMNPVLDPPKRPATSFLWFTSPWKSFKHIIWKKYKLVIITSLIILFSVLLVLLFVYSFPEVLAYKIIHI